MKLIKRLVVIGLVLLLLLVGAAFLFLDTIVRKAVETGGTAAAGVPTTLAKADASFFSGAFGLENFALANPSGFRSEPFLALKGARARWQNGTILSQHLVIDEFTLDGLELNLEQNGTKSNWKQILDNLQRGAPAAGGGASKPTPPEAEGSQRTVEIKLIQIQNTKCALHLSGPLNGDYKVDVPAIKIENLRSDGSLAEIAGKLTKAVVEAVVAASAKSGNGVFPAAALHDLEGNLKQELQDVLKGKTDPKDALKQAEKGVKDLFGGKKKP